MSSPIIIRFFDSVTYEDGDSGRWAFCKSGDTRSAVLTKKGLVVSECVGVDGIQTVIQFAEDGLLKSVTNYH